MKWRDEGGKIFGWGGKEEEGKEGRGCGGWEGGEKGRAEKTEGREWGGGWGWGGGGRRGKH